MWTKYLIHSSVFFFTDTATTEIYTLSLHDALPILGNVWVCVGELSRECVCVCVCVCARSEEHTSELQSHLNLVCLLLLEKQIHHHRALARKDFLQFTELPHAVRQRA